MRHLFLAKDIHTNWKVNFQDGQISPSINYAWGNFAPTMGEIRPFCLPLLLGLMHRRSTFIKQQTNNKQINNEMKELCQLCETRNLPFGNKAYVCRVYTAEFTPGVPRLCWKSSYSVFLKTLNFLLVWTSFLAFPFRWVCSLYVWTKFCDAGRSSPDVVEISPIHIHQKKNVFLHIHEITRVVVLYTSLR